MDKEDLYEIDLRYRTMTRLHRDAMRLLVHGENNPPEDEAALIDKIENLERLMAKREAEYGVEP